MLSNSIRVEPVGSAVGATIEGIDLSAPLGADAVGLIREALFDRGVVFFHGQSLTPEQHIAFAEQFAPININRFFRAAEGYPAIAEVRKEPGRLLLNGRALSFEAVQQRG